MDDVEPLRSLVRRWFPKAPVRISPLPSDGFSGSPVWLVETDASRAATPSRFVLKGFAAGWPRERAEGIHRLMAAARRAGIAAVPANLPLAGADGADATTITTASDGRCFEMTQWCPGHPVETPSPRQAEAAVETLARIHLALRGHAIDEQPRNAPPAWTRRVEVLRAVISRGWEGPVSARRSPLQAAVAERRKTAATLLRELGGVPWLSRLATLEPPAVPLQPVLRDVWQAHVLFEGEHVSAVIDWHAAGIDTPAADLARLLGSWALPGGASHDAGMPSRRWRGALDAYRAIRPLSAEEFVLVDLLHLTGVVGSLHHWFTWVLDEHRAFPDPSAVLARVDGLLKNLVFLVEQTDAGSGSPH